MNITDVDDKTIKKSIVENTPLKELTNKYSNIFFSDLKWLKILPANYYPRATDSIHKIIELISLLLKKGFAYVEDNGSVYFRIKSYAQYGQLLNLNFENQAGSSRIINDEYNKENPQDFALWKAWQDSDGEIAWDSPWGKGRPGWHIECSAMSNIYLGDHFDIHCGGVDNIFPHHENEIAQSRCATGKKFVNFWLHSEHLTIKGKKMSKSDGNLFKISDLKKLDFSSECLRYILLSGHYRKKILFSLDKKEEGDRVISRISQFRSRLKNHNGSFKKFSKYPKEYEQFIYNLDNDLDTPNALSVFFKWMREQNVRMDEGVKGERFISSSLNFVNAFNDIFGILPGYDGQVPSNVKYLAEKREAARKNKEWDLADKIRNDISNCGWSIEDLPDGYKLKEIKN